MSSSTDGIFREYEQRQSMIMARIDALVSASISSGLEEFQSIQERVNQIYINETNSELRNAFQTKPSSRSSIEGTIFIKDHIFSDVTEKTLTLFKDLDPSIYLFILTKAVFMIMQPFFCKFIQTFPFLAHPLVFNLFFCF